MSYFPAFLKIEGCSFLVVGGGRTALRKIEVLREFGADITVVAPEFIDEIKESNHIHLRLKEFQQDDLDGMDVVIVAADNKELAHVIAQICKQRKILVNAVDQIEDCTFIFPSYVKQGDVVAAFSSGGRSPVVTQYLKEKNFPLVTEQLAELTEFLGSLRENVKATIPTEKMRKAFYQDVLALGIKKGRVPTEEEISEIFLKYQ